VDPLLATLILISLALVGARVSFSTANISAGPRLLFRTATHFIVLGFVVVPSVLGLVTREAIGNDGSARAEAERHTPDNPDGVADLDEGTRTSPS
jgi:hypothetical protein